MRKFFYIFLLLAAGAVYAAPALSTDAMFEALGIPKDQVREAWHTPELKLLAAQWRDTKLRFESGHIGIYEVWDRELAALRALMGQPEVAVSPLMPELCRTYLERLHRQLDMLKAEHRAGFIGTDPIREKELEISEFRKRHGLSETPPSEWIRSAFAQYCAAAEKGDAAAQLELGMRLLYANEGKESLKYLRLAARQGHPTARGWCLLFGCDVEKEQKAAVECFRSEASKGEPWAQFLLGECFVWGRGVERNIEEGVSWFRKAALQGNAVAQFHLSERYQFGGVGVARNPAEAEKWIKKSAEQGFEPALRVLDAWKLGKRPPDVEIIKLETAR